MKFTERVRKQLFEAKEKGQMVAFHKWDDDPSIFLVGFVLSVNASQAEFDLVGPDGILEEETEKVKLNKLIQVHWDSNYLRDLKRLHEAGEAIYKAAVPEQEGLSEGQQIRTALVSAAQEKRAVKIWMNGEGKVAAFVNAVEDEFCELRPIVEGATLDGIHLVQISAIQKVRTGTRSEVADEYLQQTTAVC